MMDQRDHPATPPSPRARAAGARSGNTSTRPERPPEGLVTVGISFLSDVDQPAESGEFQEWQRYVHDRLHHFTISHR